MIGIIGRDNPNRCRPFIEVVDQASWSMFTYRRYFYTILVDGPPKRSYIVQRQVLKAYLARWQTQVMNTFDRGVSGLTRADRCDGAKTNSMHRSNRDILFRLRACGTQRIGNPSGAGKL